MTLIANHLLLTYVLGILSGWFGCMLSVFFWSHGKGASADAFVWPMSIAGGLFWPIGIPLCLAFWFWQMILMLARFHGKAFPEAHAKPNSCDHERVAGARFCRRCGRAVIPTPNKSIHAD